MSQAEVSVSSGYSRLSCQVIETAAMEQHNGEAAIEQMGRRLIVDECACPAVAGCFDRRLM